MLALLPATYALLDRSLLDYGEARLAIRLNYPSESTRVVGAASALAVAMGTCLIWGRTARTMRTTMFLLVGTLVGFVLVIAAATTVVQRMKLEGYPNEAAVRWFIGVGGTVLTGGVSVETVRRLRPSP
jgi:hypothetical protein